MQITQLPRLATTLLCLVTGLQLSSTQSLAAQNQPAELEIGKAAPRFTALDQSGKKVSIGGKSDTWTILAFYPKAMTPG